MESIKEWYNELADSEKKIVIIFAVICSLLILVFGLLMPISQSVNTLEKRVASAQKSVNMWQQAMPTIRAKRNSSSAGSTSQSLNTVITSSTRQFNLNVSRIQEKGTNEIQVWLDNAAFNETLLWINQLEKRYKVTVASMNIRNKQRNGIVNLDVKLQRS